jgi:YD repeat-containing protein
MRIARASDTAGHDVSYTYDDRGRLLLAKSSDGTIRAYGYDYRDKLILVREPGRIVRNWFDESGRWIRQEVRRSDDDDDPHVSCGTMTVAVSVDPVDDRAVLERAQDTLRSFLGSPSTLQMSR